MLVVVYLVGRAMGISSTSADAGSRLVSRLMFPVLGVVTFRFGQFGSCLTLVVAAAAIFMVTYGQLNRSSGANEVGEIKTETGIGTSQARRGWPPARRGTPTLLQSILSQHRSTCTH